MHVSTQLLCEESASSLDDTAVVREYVSSSRAINGYLRGVLPATPQVVAAVRVLDRIINRSDTAFPAGRTTLYRALPASVVANLTPGAQFTEPAFVSAALLRSTAERFLYRLQRVNKPQEIVRITVSGLMPACNVSDYVGGEGYDNDDEYILPRNTLWTYRGIDRSTSLKVFAVREG